MYNLYINIFIILQSNKIDFDIPGRRKDIVKKVVGENKMELVENLF